jgi:hypothetical protein
VALVRDLIGWRVLLGGMQQIYSIQIQVNPVFNIQPDYGLRQIFYGATCHNK